MIPIPPLEIQREIVRILDNFTNLTAELTKELTDRKVQYAYYRNKFLYFDESSASLKSIGDICNVVVGGEPPADCIKGEVKIHHICFQFGEMVKKRMDILERTRLIGMLS